MRPRLFVETNFVNQIVLERDEPDIVRATAQIVRWAEEQSIELALPAFSLLEAEFTFRSGDKRRNRLWEELRREELELQRSPVTRPAATELARFRETYLLIGKDESARYDAMLESFLRNAVLIPLDAGILSEATKLKESRLNRADAVVFASCLKYFETHPSQGERRIFYTQNKGDFKEPHAARLQSHDVELVTDLRGCSARILETTV
ncbi:hypothetical protein BH11ARM2_BH11ARM2_13630 [soil metagenome]